MDTGIAIIIAAIIGVLGYVVKGRIDIQAAERRQKERRYRGMLTTMRAFYVSSEGKQVKQQFVQQFVDELNQAYLYASDEVQRAANKFLGMSKIKPEASEEENKAALANFVLAMRKDLKKKTKLSASEFETWTPA